MSQSGFEAKISSPLCFAPVACVVGLMCLLGCNNEAALNQFHPGGPAGGSGGQGGNGGTVPDPMDGRSDSPGPAGGSAGGTGGMPSASEGIPCDVEAILVERCQHCHGQALASGATMPLVTWDDLHGAAPSDATKRVYESIQERVRREGYGAMPPDVRDRLSDAELAMFDAWVAEGAPKVGRQACSPPGSGDGPQGGAGGSPDFEDDEHVECVELRAHGQQTAGDTTPFNVPSGEGYWCFEFSAPWQEAVQGIRAESIIENSAVVHHWLLYEVHNPLTVDGTFSSCVGTHPDASLLAGWAPGGGDLIMPENVGLQIPYGPQGRYRLELHYYNPGAETADNSGVRLCATDKPREHLAGVTWLGTEQLGQFIPGLTGAGQSVGQILANRETKFTGLCHPARQGLGADENIHILLSWPHMHKLGTYMNTTIIRADGTREVLHDGAFNFEFQISYETPAVIRPGDRLETTCTFNNTTNRNVGFGTATEDEMCYNFVWAYPAGALNRPGFSWVGAQNTCFY
jgi:hypothetical protein